jgi:hypothetical protein
MLTLLIGLAGGSIVALVAGGQRTDSAYPRFFAKAHGADATVFAFMETPQTLAGLKVLEHLPEVTSYGALQGYTTVDGTMVGGPLGPGFEHTVSVPRLIAGRLPRGPGEVSVDWTIAQAHHLHVGDIYRVGVVADNASPNGPPTTLHLALRVVGIAVNANAFPPYSQDQSATSIVDPSFVTRYRHELGPPQLGLQLRLRGGQGGLAAFERSDRRAFPGQPVVVGSSAPQTQAVQNSIHPASVALWLLGAALAVMGVLIVFQLFRRLSAGEEDEYVTAAAQGATRRQLLAAELARAGAVAVGAAVVAAVAAIALSPLFPLGTAGVAEPNPGVWVEWPVLLIGMGSIVVLTIALAAYPAWRATRQAMAPMSVREQTSAYRGAAWAPRWLWLRPMSWVGVAHGLRTGRGASAVPVRASITAMLLAVIGLTSALTFSASLEHLVTTPALYGWSWDAHIYDNGENGTPMLVPKLVADRWLSDVIVAPTGIPIRVNGHADLGAGLDARKGSVSVVTASGRTPARANEIDLGPSTLSRLHIHLGSRVRVTVSAIQGPTRTYTVVGAVIAPWADQSGSFNGGGAVMTKAGFERLVPVGALNHIPPPSDAFVKFSPGAMTAAHMNQLRHQVGEEYSVSPAQPPTDLLNFGRVRDLPLMLALLLVGLAAVTLFLTLLSSASRRRSEMAILKAMGYRRAQLQGVVAWQSTAMTLVGLVIGLPLGIALGRWLWIVVADHLALLGQPVVPVWQIALIALGALVVANVAGAWPGLVVARTPVTRVLRAN